MHLGALELWAVLCGYNAGHRPVSLLLLPTVLALLGNLLLALPLPNLVVDEDVAAFSEECLAILAAKLQFSLSSIMVASAARRRWRCLPHQPGPAPGLLSPPSPHAEASWQRSAWIRLIANQGAVHHVLGPLSQEPRQNPFFAQSYIMDGNMDARL